MDCAKCTTANPAGNRFCRNCGQPLAAVSAAASSAPRRISRATGSLRVGAQESELRVATVLFADLTGYTLLAQQVDAEEVHEITNTFFRELAASVHRYGGTVNKYIGDEIMAMFGAPRAHEDDPERALATLLEMREAVRAVNGRLGKRLPRPFGLHAGINTGQVIAGLVGDDVRSQFDVTGDAVIVAKRLADTAGDGSIYVAESTYNLTRHAFSFEELPPITLQGIAEPVRVYNLRGRRERRRPRWGRADVRVPLVGRGAERQCLDEAVAQLRAGVGGHVAVSGPAGVGKTRLVQETRDAARAQDITWVEAACVSLGLAGSLSVWIDVIRVLSDAATGSGFERRTGPIKPSGATRMLSLDEVRDASAALAGLLGMDSLDGIDDEARGHRLFLGVRDRIEAAARRRPLVLVLDDLHWCDTASMQLLAFVLESTTRAPLLVVTSFRSDADTIRAPLEQAVTKAAPPFRLELDLRPLDTDESVALADALTGGGADMAEVRRLLVRYAEGNPLFMEEIMRSLESQAVIQQRDGRWSTVSGAALDVEVPETLNGLLVDRIDRLPDASKRLVQIAAVIGRSFPAALLAEIADIGKEVTSLLATLEQAGVVAREGADGNETYRFRHALMQEAAYGSLLLRRRHVHHRRVAEWYEQHQDAPAAELATTLAHHWERAGVWDRAGVWALRAADEARRAYALSDAHGHYQRALTFAEKADDEGLRRSAHHGLGEVAFAEGNAETALEHLVAALDLARDPLERAVLERRVGQAMHRSGRHGVALATFEGAAGILGEGRPDEPPEWTAERARLRVATAFAHLSRGDVEPARRAAEAALRANLPAADRADATLLLGAAALRTGEVDLAVKLFDEALQLARSTDDHPRTAAALEQLALAHLRLDRRQQARAALEEWLTVSRRLGDAAGCGRALLELAAIAEHDGSLREAAALLRDASRNADNCDEPAIGAVAELRLGRVLRTLGEWAEARVALERAGGDDPEIAGRAMLELALLGIRGRGELPDETLHGVLEAAERLHLPDLAAQARLGLAATARRRGQRDTARAHLRAVLQTSIDQETESTSAARLLLAELALDEHRTDLAVASAKIALEATERTGPAALVWTARRTHGAALSADGQHQAAETELRLATEAARAAGALPELATCLGDWARARGAAPGHPTADTETHAMIAEMRGILAALTESARPPDPAPATPAESPHRAEIGAR